MVVEASAVVPRYDDDRISPVFALCDGIDDFRKIRLGYLMVGAPAPWMIIVSDIVLLAGRIVCKDRVGRLQSVRIRVAALDPENALVREVAVLDVRD